MPCRGAAAYFRFNGVTSSAGYGFVFTYLSNASGGHFSTPPSNWFVRTGATFTSGASPSPSVSYSTPSAGVDQLVDMGGRTWTFTSASDGTYHIRRPGSSSDNVVVSFGTGGVVSSVTKDGVTTSYSRSVSGTAATMTITNALSQTTTVVSDLTIDKPTSITDGNSHTTTYAYDTNGRLTRVTSPEGNYTNYTYDSRGNVTETRQVAKSGSGLSDVVATANFDSSCTNPVKCNEPNSTTDPRGNTTSYTYDSTHGGVVTATLPAPTTGAVQPQTRYSYTSTGGVYMLTGISQCQTTSSCSGGADEAKTSISYNSNLLPTSISSGDGSGALTATTAATYDSIGNLVTVDGPLSGTADTTMFRYNSARERIGTISPDPDGTGSLKNRAQRTTYDSHGLVTRVEHGTVNSQSDTDWAAFSNLEEIDVGYDSNLREVTRSLASGGGTYAVTQTSYDALGRVQCEAQRMNPGAYGSLPSDACTLGTTGSYGADRIVKTGYDAAGQVNLVQSAYGVTGVQSDDVASTYTNNGQVASVTDAESNKTSYVYDGLDRLSQTFYPSTTKGAGTSSSTDYEQLSYDAAGNITSRRLRDGNSIGVTFDALNRVTFKDLPGSEPDVTYSYDNLGRLTGASQTGNSLSFTYDALGRKLTETGPQGTVTSTWDIGGRRMQVTWPDSFYVNYDYLTTGEVSAIRENGATSGVGVLATYAYDNLGKRTSLTRGNGTTMTYGYDAVSRLTSLSEDLSGTTYDQTLGFSYNPASHIIQTSRSNDNYAWGGHYNVNTSYTENGLNQYSAVGSTTPTYDSRGNLTSAGATTYGYSSENLLTSTSGGIALTYDPALRLYQLSGGSPGTQRFAYDGLKLIAEYNSSNTMLRRYVRGPGTDEPIVWYEGSGTTDRRFLHTDERGSVVAVTNSSGAALSVNSYDEYGLPASSNTGRFQYTGQAWLPELGVYYYKARMYASGLGRFMQTDPIGYGDSLNLYAYTGGNPINFSDPAGTATTPPTPNPLPCSDPDSDPNNCTIVSTGHIVKGVTGNAGALGQGGNGSSGSGSGGSTTPQCRALQQAADRAQAQAQLPGYLTQNNNWNNPATLQGYENLYQEHLNQFEWLRDSAVAQWGLNFAIGMIPVARAVTVGRAVVGAATGATAGSIQAAWIQSQVQLNQKIVDAIKARIAQVKAGC